MKKRPVALLLCACMLFSALFSSCGKFMDVAARVVSAAASRATEGGQNADSQDGASSSGDSPSSSESLPAPESELPAEAPANGTYTYAIDTFVYQAPKTWETYQRPNGYLHLLPDKRGSVDVFIGGLNAATLDEAEAAARARFASVTSTGEYGDIKTIAKKETDAGFFLQLEIHPSELNITKPYYRLDVYFHGSSSHILQYTYFPEDGNLIGEYSAAIADTVRYDGAASARQVHAFALYGMLYSAPSVCDTVADASNTMRIDHYIPHHSFPQYMAQISTIYLPVDKNIATRDEAYAYLNAQLADFQSIPDLRGYALENVTESDFQSGYSISFDMIPPNTNDLPIYNYCLILYGPTVYAVQFLYYEQDFSYVGDFKPSLLNSVKFLEDLQQQWADDRIDRMNITLSHTQGDMMYTLPANWLLAAGTNPPQFVLPGNCAVLTVSQRPQPQPITSLANAKPQFEQCAKDMLVELTGGKPGGYDVQNFAVSQTGDAFSAEFDIVPAAPGGETACYTVRLFAQGGQLYRMVFEYNYPNTAEVLQRIEKAVILILFTGQSAGAA